MCRESSVKPRRCSAIRLTGLPKIWTTAFGHCRPGMGTLATGFFNFVPELLANTFQKCSQDRAYGLTIQNIRWTFRAQPAGPIVGRYSGAGRQNPCRTALSCWVLGRWRITEVNASGSETGLGHVQAFAIWVYH